MNKIISLTAALLMACSGLNAQTMIGKNNIQLSSDLMTPEALWAMGRIGTAQASPDGKKIVYQVGYYSVKENKSHQILFVMDADGQHKKQLTEDATSESDAAWINNRTIAFIRNGQIWSTDADGSNRRQLTNSKTDIEGFIFSPDGKQVILIKSIPYHGIAAKYQKDYDTGA